MAPPLTALEGSLRSACGLACSLCCFLCCSRQDAHEFLADVLDELQEEMAGAPRAPPRSPPLPREIRCRRGRDLPTHPRRPPLSAHGVRDLRAACAHGVCSRRVLTACSHGLCSRLVLRSNSHRQERWRRDHPAAARCGSRQSAQHERGRVAVRAQFHERGAAPVQLRPLCAHLDPAGNLATLLARSAVGRR